MQTFAQAKRWFIRSCENSFWDDAGSNEGLTGIEELQEIWKYLEHSPLTNTLKFDIAAHGLSYYTGTIFEVTANDVDILGGGCYV